jgi:hypothetical protein
MSKDDLKAINDFFSKLPEVQAGKDICQNKHHEFDVFEHTQKYVEYISELSNDKDIIAAGWLHDIGKPVTATTELDKDGKIIEKEPGKHYHNFRDHEHVGREMVLKMNPDIFNRFGLNQERIARLVGCHFIPMKGIKHMRKATNFEDFVVSFNSLNDSLSNLDVKKEEVLLMFLADKLAQGNTLTDKKELFIIRETLLKENRTEEDLRKIFKIEKAVL